MQHNPWTDADGKPLKRSDVLLMLIDERCNDKGIYYVPRYGDERIEAFNAYTQVTGPGDRAALNALIRRGLIRHMPQTGGYQITEEGRLRAQEIR